MYLGEGVYICLGIHVEVRRKPVSPFTQMVRLSGKKLYLLRPFLMAQELEIEIPNMKNQIGVVARL